MATSITLSTSPSVSTTGQVIYCTATLSSPPSDPVRSVLRIEPYLTNGTTNMPNAAGGFPGNCNISIGAATLLSPTATAAATLTFNWVTQIFGPSAPLNPVTPASPLYDAYNIGCVVYFSDGTIAQTQNQVFYYPLQSGSSLALTAMPGNGGVGRLDSNMESQHIGDLEASMIASALAGTQPFAPYFAATTV